MNRAASARVKEAIAVLSSVGMPKAQQNERSGLCLLALLDLHPTAPWSDARDSLLGITPIMDWIRIHYKVSYAPNTRETIRRQTMHQFVAAGIAVYNPDEPDRPVNSPHAVYQIAPSALELLRFVGAPDWDERLTAYLSVHDSLVERYKNARERSTVPVRIADKESFRLSPGAHSELMRHVVEEFAPGHLGECDLVYVGDTGEKWSYFDRTVFEHLGLELDLHGKMPDVVLYEEARNWLVLVECVTSHGPVDGKRYDELATLFSGSSAGLVFVTAFPDRATMAKYLGQIAWETEVWVASDPTHLIHFNGDRFLGPY